MLNRSSAALASAPSLLGYALRGAAASEMLYGGVRLQHLAAAPPPLRRQQPETLPPPADSSGEAAAEGLRDGEGDGWRLLPVNIGARARAAAVRLRADDCRRRLIAQRVCAAAAAPLVFPAPPVKQSGEGHGRRGAAYFHPPSAKLSLFTRPVDCGSHTAAVDTRPAGVGVYHPRAWRPLQMLKPMPHNWSPTLRSSGVRGPNMQLMQERLDGKGFGWKRKSRSLWQQDIDTAGFRPKRFF
ncbi:uncharacterized protein TM35_000031400 [Trypanosoma theileri]|uniref:Uncharacterized protein n=1 Tax=Trypanosoma theileri TaxID=67003 RepID=A0A1X0P627_9TRYP|nr:uncharacterized protein TM35_000031400 [Trypanosoma theileri]ORC92387.1 hypothetical protein TM35_000031400 [Trypanosoma theileri]